MFFGLGADGTVGANKASVKIIGEHTDLFAQGYFVYDSKKSGSVTVSHLRFGPRADPLDVPHRGCRLRRLPPVRPAREDAGARPCQAGSHVPAQQPVRSERSCGTDCRTRCRSRSVEKDLAVWAIDAYRVAGENELGARINTVMQPCFFALAGVIPADEAIDHIKASVEHAYGRRGATIVERNFAAIDASLAALARVEIPSDGDGAVDASSSALPADAPGLRRPGSRPG